MRTQNRNRRRLGASLGIVVAVAFLLIVIIIASFQAMIYLGGSRELRHSVDAAVLNVSKRATENKIACNAVTGYDDCADATQMVGLTNINRVWGKAYLVSANEDAMSKTAQNTGISQNNATRAFAQAQQLNDGVYNLLQSKTNSDSHFKQIAQNKPARLLQNGSEVYTDKTSNWAIGWIYRGEESNLKVDTAAIPAGVTPKFLVASGTTYLQGFNPMQANNQNFCFTTFHANEAPHLITQNAFNQAKTAVSGAVNPIPNAFQESGQVKNSQVPLMAQACAVANPMRGYYLAIPHAYVTININNTATWIVQGKMYALDKYFPNEGTIWRVKSYNIMKPGKGIEDGYASVGNEYQPANLWHAINNALPGDHTVVINTLLQRIKQFRPNYTKAQLQALLTNTPYSSGVTTWYLYPTYTQPDLTDPKVVVSASVTSLPAWINLRDPIDGKGKAIMQEGPVVNAPNTCWSNIRQGPYKTDQHSTTETGTVTFTPGTGWTQYLGDMNFSRNTVINFTALP